MSNAAQQHAQPGAKQGVIIDDQNFHKGSRPSSIDAPF
jgi:hypothetical protein